VFASTAWPSPEPGALHPAVVSMPRDAEQSISSVARYIAERETDPAGRFRAAHDWVADRIAYDGPSYAARRFPPQDAQSVFKTRIAVCAGYAKLLTALGKELGLEVAYVVGDARTSGNSEAGDSHAWSAVKLGDRYHLADATWNSGSLDGTTFVKRYSTDYLFTPPEVFGLDHFPGDPRWQLRATPISRGEFFRQPMMTPRFHAEGRELLTPQRSQVTVSGPFTAEVRTRSGLWTLASWTTDPAQSGTHCAVENGPTTRVRCDLPGKGRYLVRLFSGPEQYGKYHYIGQFEANRE
jgi:transglutaminase/protease-like cytokinesis protein 3